MKRRSKRKDGATSPIRVVMLLENAPYPGDPRVAQEANTLVAAGYDVSVICPKRSGQSWRSAVDGVRVYRFWSPAAPKGAGGYVVEFSTAVIGMFAISLALFARRGFHVVHAHNPPDVLFLIAAFYKWLGKQFVYDHHDLSPELYHARFNGRGHALVYRTLVRLERLSCRIADHVIAPNESHKRLEMERGQVPEARITIVRNGPRLDLWQPSVEPMQLRAGDGPLIAYGGVIGPQDGVDYLIRAMHHLVCVHGRTDIRCLIVGDGDALPGLKQLASELGVDQYVIFLGWVQERELVRALAAADICVEPAPPNPYTERSTMIKLMNYMALGKPIVAFDLLEHRVTADGAACYVPGSNDVELAETILQLIDDPERRCAMGILGRQRVEQKLAWRYSAANLLRAYESLEIAVSD